MCPKHSGHFGSNMGGSMLQYSYMPDILSSVSKITPDIYLHIVVFSWQVPLLFLPSQWDRRKGVPGVSSNSIIYIRNGEKLGK